MDSVRDLFFLFLKGMAMGAADVVPGVSGGTIAFISGIYEKLIHSIKGLTPAKLLILKNQGIKPFWTSINGTFLAVLGAGVLGSIISLAHLITWLMKTYPEMLWSFFFGLVISSAILIFRQLEKVNASAIISIVIGFALAWNLNKITPTTATDPNLLMVFTSGAIAICAMILPGISGAFILLILGMYEYVIEALKSIQIDVVLVFAIGCATGLILFSRLLSLMFLHMRHATLALLTGFMLGSLNKIWPWKLTLETTTDRHGQIVPLIQENISPLNYEALTSQNPFLWQGALLMICAFLLVGGLEKLKTCLEDS